MQAEIPITEPREKDQLYYLNTIERKGLHFLIISKRPREYLACYPVVTCLYWADAQALNLNFLLSIELA
jgi:hypothetical protein